MKSVTKNLLDEATIKRLVARQFPHSKIEAVEEQKGGMFNSAYKIAGTGMPEKSLVLKVGPAPGTKTLTYEKDILRTEVDVYGMLDGRSIPIPKIFASDFSGEIIPSAYFFMQRLPGCTWNSLKRIPAPHKAKLMREFGCCNAAVHNVEGGWFGYIKDDERFRFDSWGTAFSAMISDILDDGRRDKIKLPYEAIALCVQKHYSLLDAVKTPRLVDFDMWPGNVFVQEENGAYTISGVVDFERAFFGDPYADFTSAATLFEDVEKEPDFINGYAEASGAKLVITDADRIRTDLYRLYMAIILGVETYRYNPAYASMVKMYSRSRIKKLLSRL